jgi:hypothetical protein
VALFRIEARIITRSARSNMLAVAALSDVRKCLDAKCEREYA